MLLKLQRDKLFLLHPKLQLEWLARGKFHLQSLILDHIYDYYWVYSILYIGAEYVYLIRIYIYIVGYCPVGD